MSRYNKYSAKSVVSGFSQILNDVYNFGFFHLLSANFVIGFIGFASQLLVAKFLTPLELGQIKAIQSFIAVAAILSGFGFNTAVLKLCSEKRPVEEKAFIFKQNFFFTIVPVIIVLVILFLLSRSGLLSPDRTVNKWLPLYMMVIPAMTYTSLIMVYLQALKKIELMAKVQVVIRVPGFIVLVVLTYFYGLLGFIISTIFVGYVALPPLFYLVKDSFKSKVGAIKSFSQSFYFAKWSLAANTMGALGQYMDIFVLNYLIEDRVSFGYYGLATIFILGLNLITATAQDIAGPHFSERNNDKKEFVRVLKKYEKIMVLFAFGISVITVIIVPIFIEVVYGANFAPAGVFFQILVLKYFFRSCSVLLGTSMSIGLGKIKYTFLSASISVVLNLILSYLFITYYGILGAAIAQAFAFCIHFIIVIFMLRHVVRIHFGNETAAVKANST